MKRIISLVVSTVFFVNISCHADEGMWLPLLLQAHYPAMQEMGLKLTPEQLYSINHSSLKDAIISLDHGECTGEIISQNGLVLTNHHCGFGQIQAHSTVEKDYITNGFWAMRAEDELPNPGKTASFLIRIEDVTDQIYEQLPKKVTESERHGIVKQISEQITSKAIAGTEYEADVVSFFGGNAYYLFVYETYRDVRLVGAPPSAIGDFGGDVDNWMWPRHTGDFTLFRIYTGPDGRPADYSPANIPMKPKYVLPISNKGIQINDFAMIWGYPGSTERYLTSYGVEYTINTYNPAIERGIGAILEKMKEKMDQDPAIRIKYASKYASTANFWKLFYGQSRALRKLNAIELKQKHEMEFREWLMQNSEREARYGKILDVTREAYQNLINSRSEVAVVYFSMIYNKYAGEMIAFAGEVVPYLEELASVKDNADILKQIEELAAKHYKDYDLQTDKEILIAQLKYYIKDVPEKFFPDFIQTIQTKYKGDITAWADELYKKSVFSSPDKFAGMLKKPKPKIFQNDPAFLTFNSLKKSYVNIENAGLQESQRIESAKRLYIKALMEMKGDNNLSPDANSTMRCTYGTIIDYKPFDAVHFSWVTTTKGLLEKDDPDDPDFRVPEKLKLIVEKSDFKPWCDSLVMPICFITNNDITGGNSGSPVLNGDGELIGLAFDSNWEGVGGDIVYYPQIQRTVCVDIRYVLLIIDRFADAKNIINELNIVY